MVVIMLDALHAETPILFKVLVSMGAIFVALLSGATISWFAKKQMGEQEWGIFYRENFNMLVGLPQACVVAFGIVLYFNIATDEPLKLTLFNFTFSGPAVPAIIWMVLFLSIIFGIKLLSKRS